MNGITDGSCLHDLNYLLEFLAAWEKRPAYLTPMAYQWCSVISEAAGRFDPSEITINMLSQLNYYLRHGERPRPQDLATFSLQLIEREFSKVGPGRDPANLDATPHDSRGRPHHLAPPMYVYLLFITLEIGFRHVTPSRHQSVLLLHHTSHHKWVLETAFSSDDDDVIADALRVWTVGSDFTPLGSCARYLAKRMGRDTPFSPRLRLASARAIERIWRNELKESGLETVCWLNRLNANADDVVEKGTWAELLVEVIRSSTGFESLSSHYWHLLDKLVVASRLFLRLTPRDTEVMRLFEEAEDWEKLGAWMVVVWSILPLSESMEGMEDLTLKDVTLKLLSRRLSVFPRFEDLCEAGTLAYSYRRCRACKDKLQRICDQARLEQLPSESPPP